MFGSINTPSELLAGDAECQGCIGTLGGITVMQPSLGWCYYSSETDKKNKIANIKVFMIQRWLGALSISCMCPQGRYYSLPYRKLQDSSWTLKLETSTPSTSPDTPTLPFVWTQSLQPWDVCGAINSAPAYWVGRIARHAACSRLLLWQTCTLIPVCKVTVIF